MKEIYLHIGIPKTGTTSIQYCLSSRRDQLRSIGILYPESFCSGGAHFELSNLFGFGPNPTLSRSQLDELSDEIEESSCNKVVFSSENFVLNGDLENLYRFFKAYQCRIVVYLRRHDTWWPSAYQESVKQVKNPPWGMSFESFVAFQKGQSYRYWEYGGLLDRWAKYFGSENIIVRPYERTQIGDDVVADFFSALGDKDAYAMLGEKNLRKNDSMNALTLKLMDVYQRGDFPGDVRAKLMDAAARVSCDLKASAFCSTKIISDLLEECDKDYQYIARKYLNRENGVLFFDPLKLTSNEEYASAMKLLTLPKLVESVVQACTESLQNK